MLGPNRTRSGIFKNQMQVLPLPEHALKGGYTDLTWAREGGAGAPHKPRAPAPSEVAYYEDVLCEATNTSETFEGGW